MSWDELVAVALLGTDRRPVEADAPPGAPAGLEAALAERGAEDRLLASAAAWTVARRAGARPGPVVAVEPADEDPRPLCSDAAASRLASLFEFTALVPEWLALAERAGVRPPPELVPALLDHAEGWPERHAAIEAAAGPLGRWLAAREPRWAFVLPAGEEVWRDGTPEARQLLLQRLRREDPDAGRALLASTFAEETWEDREAFLHELEAGLSDADEPLLESALDDRRKPVRDAAARLLARLPRSAFAARAAARVLGLLRVEDDEIHVTLPDAPDVSAKRDGVPQGGRRSERLSAMLAAAPLATWDPRLVHLDVADDLGAAVHSGWIDAALNQGDAAWARALWREDPALLPLLPRAEAEALAASADDPVSAAEPLDWTWGPELSRAVIDSIKQRREAGIRDVDVRFVGTRLDPALDAEPLRDLGGRDLWALCDTVAIRAAMLRELG